MAGFWIVVLFGWIGIVIIIAMLLILIINFIGYLFESLSICEYMKRTNMPMRGTAFIPCYNKYLLGCISGNSWLGIIEAIVNAVKLLSFALMYIATEEYFTYVGTLFIIAALLGWILNTIMAGEIFGRFTKNRAIYTALSVVSLGILRPIFLFVFLHRNKEYAYN